MAVNGKHNVCEDTPELLFFVQKLPPHPGNFSCGVPEDGSQAERSYDQVPMAAVGCDAEYGSHLLLHQLLLLLERVAGARFIEPGSSDWSDRYDW